VPTDFPDELFLALLDRYLAGESTPSEAQIVRDWLALDAQNRVTLEQLERVRSVVRNRPPTRSADDAWNRAARELEVHRTADESRATALRREGVSETRPRVQPLARTRSMFGRRRYATWVAAATVLIIASAVAYRVNSRTEPVVAAGEEARNYVTSPGQRATIQLADGTQITIGPSSRLRVEGDFGITSRDVSLAGEAYFKVHHDDARPFRVHTSHGVAEDLGTEFIVSAFEGSTSDQVVVSSGKVSLGGTTLSRGQLGRIDQSGKVKVISDVDLELHFGWVDGRVSFRDSRLDQALVRLSRWYDVDFQLADTALGAMKLTASFKEESLSEVLESLDLTLGLRHRTSGRSVIFYSPSQDGSD
jgi:transmembrane sensor